MTPAFLQYVKHVHNMYISQFTFTLASEYQMIIIRMNRRDVVEPYMQEGWRWMDGKGRRERRERVMDIPAIDFVCVCLCICV